MIGTALRGTITRTGSGKTLWSGDLVPASNIADGVSRVVHRVTGLKPDLWSPQSPALYSLTVTAANGVQKTVRFGFRSFASHNGRMLLNGRPVFLRGNAINPPERTIPDSLDENRKFVEDYVRYQKLIGVNIIRLTRHSQIWFDVADELGMMLFQGNYGTPKWATPTSAPSRPFNEVMDWYKQEVFEPLVNHPSVVVYILTNEQAAPEIPYLHDGGQEIDSFLTRAYDVLRLWDPNRAYIGNAGYGFGRAGDVCDIHRYWGWYNNSVLSFYTLRDPHICWRSDAVQPITLSENTGNYTGVDGRFNLVSNSKQPDSQLNWTGHAPDSEQSARALGYQAFTARNAIEITRRLRARNPYLAGLMPFTILFHNWWDIGSFADMKPKPVAAQFAVSYQPVLLSWELWTPQVYAGSVLRPVAHVVNDSDNGEDLKGLVLDYTLMGTDGAVRVQGKQQMDDVAYYSTTSRQLSLTLPVTLATGMYRLQGRLSRAGKELSRNEASIFVAHRDFASPTGALDRRIRVYDSSGATARALRDLKVPFDSVSRVAELLPARDVFVIGAGSWNAALADQSDQLAAFVRGGGRVLVLEQSPGNFGVGWLPSHVRLQTEPLDHPLIYPEGRPYRNGMAVNPERPDHPVFSGIDRDRLFLWSDFTNWREDKPGFPVVYPVTQGFVLTDPDDIERTAVLANYGHGLEGIALAEMFDGRGSVLLSGFNLIDRHATDPIADRMLMNLIGYQATNEGHHAQPLVTDKIKWGDYASERGVVTGIYSGLLLNTVPIVPAGLEKGSALRVDANGFQYAGSGSGWNTRPAIQYVGQGRRPMGPYVFSLAGSVRLPVGHSAVGVGQFWTRIPAGRSRMITTVKNPSELALEFEIQLNGKMQRQRVEAGATAIVASPLTGNAVAVRYRGDRRLVILETAFQ